MLNNNTVNPFNIPETTMSRECLEYWILFTICVAGKGAKQTEEKVNAFLDNIPVPRIMGATYQWQKPITPFKCVEYLRSEGKLLMQLHKYKLGKYNLLNKAFRAAITLDLDNITLESLQQVPGIGPKSARMILLYSRPNQDLVPLDTHILKFLKAQGIPNVPKSTPPKGKNYQRLEQEFIKIAKAEGKTIREKDTEVWLSYAKQ